MIDLLHEIAQSLRRNRTRTALTGIAVAWGIFMLIVLLGMANGVVNAVEYNVSHGSNMQTVTILGGYTIYPYDGYEPGRSITLHASDGDALRENDRKYIDDVLPTASGNGKPSITSEKGDISAQITGVYPGYINIDRINLISGRYINDLDITQNRKVMIITERQAQLLFSDPSEALGATVRYLDMVWKIVGVYSHRWRSKVYVPYTTLKMLQGNTPEAGTLEVITKNMADMEDVENVNRGIIKTLARLHHFDPREGDAGGIWMWNSFASYLRNVEALNILNTAVWVIGILTLLSGIIGISNIMFVSVKERTHEIGIRRAIGAKPRSILSNVILESVTITAFFGYVGIICGMGITALIGHFIGNIDALRDPGITPAMAFEVTLLLVFAGALAGLFPALKAIKVKPVEALRDE